MPMFGITPSLLGATAGVAGAAGATSAAGTVAGIAGAAGGALNAGMNIANQVAGPGGGQAQQGVPGSSSNPMQQNPMRQNPMSGQVGQFQQTPIDADDDEKDPFGGLPGGGGWM